MNPRIGTLFKLCAGACLVLISFTAYWQIWAASGLAARQDNARLVYRQLQIKRGLILAANGHTVLATNTERTKDGLDVFLRRYPLGPLFGHPIGYNTVGSGRSGLELSQNDYLTASNADLSTILGRIGDKLQGETVTGNNVVTSLSVPAQRAAMQGLRGPLGRRRCDRAEHRPGAGDGLDARLQPEHGRPQLRQAEQARSSGAPLLNRGTQGLYAPGSTFKVVTATAALESGKFTPEHPDQRARHLHHRADGAAVQRRRRERRGGVPVRRAHVLLQHGVRTGGTGRRAAAPVRNHAGLRVLPRSAARLPVRRDGAERALQPRPPAVAAGADRRRAGWRSGRSGWG